MEVVLKQIDWIKEKEEKEELAEWLEEDKKPNSGWRPFSHSPKNWWKMLPVDDEREEEITNRYINILYKGLMKKLNR